MLEHRDRQIYLCVSLYMLNSYQYNKYLGSKVAAYTYTQGEVHVKP